MVMAILNTHLGAQKGVPQWQIMYMACMRLKFNFSTDTITKIPTYFLSGLHEGRSSILNMLGSIQLSWVCAHNSGTHVTELPQCGAYCFHKKGIK